MKSIISFVLFFTTFSLVHGQLYDDRANKFGLELLYFTQAETSGHAVLTPWSVWDLLTRITIITCGDTNAQLKRALFLPNNSVEIIMGISNLEKSIERKSASFPLSIRNYAILDTDVDKSIPVFVRILRKLEVELIVLNLKDPNSAVLVANRFMFDAGKDVHKNLLQSTDVDPSGIILTNTNTFNGIWKHAFVRSKDDEPFFDIDGKKEIGRVNMMSQTATVSYSYNGQLNSEIIELPYADERYALIVILPDKDIGISDMYQKFEVENIDSVIQILKIFRKVKLRITLPRFKISTNYVLNQALNNMGVFDLFEKQFAQFYDAPNKSIFVPVIVQNTNFEICLLALAATCQAGFESLDGGHGQDSSGFQYSAPLTSGGGHDFSSQGNDYSGQSQDFGGQSHGVSGEGHDFSAGQGNDYTLALTQGHGQNFDQGYGQNFDQGHGQNFDQGHGQFNVGHGPLLGNFGGDSYLQAAHDLGQHQGDFSGSDGGQQGYGHQGFLLEDGGHDFGHGGHDLGNVEAVPVGEHIDEEHPVEVPLYKHVTVPIHKPLHVNVPKPILVGVPQPYPVKVPVHKPVAVPVETEISIPIEKPVPYPVVKHIPYPVEKHVPIKIEKTVTVHVPQPYPVKIPVYKTIHHHKDHH
ncbi:unnamed protein product [Leptosia nina]|uniref:Serpin domain-containing protein n=1 Tax=Leptosia nina TaxID=320188 RepID=A0AAV1JDR6_9NEOP